MEKTRLYKEQAEKYH